MLNRLLALVLITVPAMGVLAETPATQPDAEARATQELLVFIQPTGSDVARDFDRRVLPKAMEMAEAMGVAVQVIDASEGAPEIVRLTPLFVYQNHRGRSVYLGRTKTLDRLRNHMRTGRFSSPPLDAASPHNGEPTVRMGRMTLGMPIKVTPLNGTLPEGFDAKAFDFEAQQAIAGVLSQPVLPRPTMGGVSIESLSIPSDRLFYVDFYPHRSEDDRLFISLGLFSQFHCHEPVWTSGDEPIAGPWDERDRLFAEAAKRLKKEIETQIASPRFGDGFDPVTSAPTKSFDELGLMLPPKPEAAEVDLSSVELGREWVADLKSQNERPVVSFRFPPPIRGYAGEAQTLEGEFTLGEDLAITGASGSFTVPVSSLTMGEPDLDAYLKSGILLSGQHPESTFTIESLEAGDAKPAFGRTVPITMTGSFAMKGQTIPLTVPATLDAFVGEDGKPRLSISGSWKLDLKDPFNISDAPPGPGPQNHTLDLDCYIVLMPAATE
ncbi:MAG: YceI family protein [Planctomycetota bacterium]